VRILHSGRKALEGDEKAFEPPHPHLLLEERLFGPMAKGGLTR
jgi:hypothetical protein